MVETKRGPRDDPGEATDALAAERPLVSVVVPTFNRETLLPRALESVLAQSHDRLQLVVVDDGSTDGTEAVVRSLDDARLLYLKQPRRGRSAARNAGAARAGGSVLAFLDSDDEAEPRWLEELVGALARPPVQIAFCGVRQLGRDGSSRELLPHPLGAVFGHQKGHLLTGAFAVRRELFLAAGGYDETIHHAENTELGVRLIAHCLAGGGATASVDRALVRYHQRHATPSEEGFRHRLDAARRLLALHGERFREDAPRGYASLLSVAGVNAARLGLMEESRRHFRDAMRAEPGKGLHIGRYLVACVPPLARRVWLRGLRADR